MRRNLFEFTDLRALKAAFCASALLFQPALASAGELSLATFSSQRGNTMRDFLVPFADEVARLSGGELTIKIYPGGALNANPKMQYSVVTQGVADISFIIPGYTSDIFPIANTLAHPGFVSDDADATTKLWNAADEIQTEVDAKILSMWATANPILITRDKEVRTLEDLQGLKLRVASADDAAFVQALGANPVSQPITVLSQNLANGIIDGIFIIGNGVSVYKLWESGKFITRGIPMPAITFMLAMNKDVYAGLSEQEKGWIDQVSGQGLLQPVLDSTIAEVENAMNISRENGVTIIDVAPEEIARMKAAMAPSIEGFLAQEIRPGLTRQDIVNVMNGE